MNNRKKIDNYKIFVREVEDEVDELCFQVVRYNIYNNIINFVYSILI